MSNKLFEFVMKIISFFKKREVIMFFIFFVITTLSFGLGYLYAKDESVAPIIIEKKC